MRIFTSRTGPRTFTGANQRDSPIGTSPARSFVHGALCVSYSGQCYLSEAMCGRSANRGECAQYCRLPYTLIDGKGNVIAKDKHLLSLRDLNQSDRLEELLDAGVSSFKIEGRLKDMAYVKTVRPITGRNSTRFSNAVPNTVQPRPDTLR